MKNFIKSNIKDIPEVPGVYGIRSKSLNKIYIGSSHNVQWRLLNHHKELGFDYSQLPVSDESDLEFQIFEYLNSDTESITLVSREGYYIRKYKDLICNLSPTGTGYDSGKGRIWMNDGKFNYRIYPEQISEHPNLVIGFLGNAIKGTTNITKEGLDKRVKLNTLDHYLNEGWSLGREFAPTNSGWKGKKIHMNNGTDEIYIVCTWYSYWKSKGYRAGKLSEKYPIINNGVSEFSIYDWELPEYLNTGWKLGYIIEREV